MGCNALLRERKYGVLSWIDANVKSVLAFKIFLICFKNIPPQNVTIAKTNGSLSVWHFLYKNTEGAVHMDGMEASCLCYGLVHI